MYVPYRYRDLVQLYLNNEIFNSFRRYARDWVDQRRIQRRSWREGAATTWVGVRSLQPVTIRRMCPCNRKGIGLRIRNRC